jgi:acetolactate synthase-1/2/3 large subunit
VINNQYLGMVRQWQDMIYRGHRAETSLADPNQADTVNADGEPNVYPDFLTIAAGYGVAARRVWQPQELPGAYRQMLAADGPYLLDVIVSADEDVYPMIPAGGTYKDVLLPESTEQS